MKVAVTGADGFLGWHLRCALMAQGQHDVVAIGRDAYTPTGLRDTLHGCDAVVHLAGVNRGTDADVSDGNAWLADTLAEAVLGSSIRRVVHGNSVHADTDSAFGRSKVMAAQTLAAAAKTTGASSVDVMLPNIFGEGGKPHYNSFVATFCHELVNGRRPEVHVDREVPLLHAQDAADELIESVEGTDEGERRPLGEPHTVNEVLGLLQDMTSYPSTGDFPDLSTRFRTALFSTFQSYCFPSQFPIDRTVHADVRGALYESVRASATDTLSFMSTTMPGAVRGQHFHRRKVERFLVVSGRAEIRLRRVCSDQEVAFQVAGDRPQAVDMPTLWAHSLKNTGDDVVTTAFWANELLDPDAPDTHRYQLYPEGEAS